MLLYEKLEEEEKRRYQQDDFRWSWALIAAVLFLALQGVILAVLPRFIYAYVPQGMGGLLVSIIVAFVGGVALALFSPGKTFFDAPVGATIAAVPTLSYIATTTPMTRRCAIMPIGRVVRSMNHLPPRTCSKCRHWRGFITWAPAE